MTKFTDISYRDIDVSLPQSAKDFFDYLDPYAKLEYTSFNSNGGPMILKQERTSNPKYIHATLCGGATRDLLCGVPYNDFDLIAPDAYRLRNSPLYGSRGFIYVGGSGGSNYPQHIYEKDGTRIEFHPLENFICTDDTINSQAMIPPGKFDFTINEIHMTMGGRFFATPLTWFDFDNRILRMNVGRRVTSNAVVRMVRLAIKCHLNIDTTTLKCVMYKLHKGYLNEENIYRQLKKCIKEGIGDACFDWLKKLGYPNIWKFDDMSSFTDDMYRRVRVGGAIVLEPSHSSYDSEL